MGLYSIPIDSIIRDLFYETDSKYNTESSFLHGLIESKLGIVSEESLSKDKNCRWTKANGSQIKIEIRTAPDKIAETIANKVSRKSERQNPDNVPWSINLISDHKRNSVVFDTKKDIYD